MSQIHVQGLGIGKVLRDVSFQVPKGACAGFAGINGAGKSTLIALLAGVLRQDDGSIDGTRGAAYLPEGCPLDDAIPVRRWLALAPSLPGWDPAFGAELISTFDLPLKRPAGSLSQGQRVRLGLILTLGRLAPVYLLDDPFLGLDPVAKAAAESFIARRSAESTIVLAAQDGGAIERLCTHLGLLHEGTLKGFARIDEWREKYPGVRRFDRILAEAVA
jgi:ABC-2 type transport system ATP-binding protein